MLSVNIPRLATEYRYDVLVSLVSPALTLRFASAPDAEVTYDGETYRRDTDEQAVDISLPRLDGTLERQECGVRLAAVAGYETVGELASTLSQADGGLLAMTLDLYLRFPDVADTPVLHLFSGRAAAMETDGEARLLLLFRGEFGQIDAQRVVYLTDGDQRAVLATDDSLSQIGTTEAIVWGRAD